MIVIHIGVLPEQPVPDDALVLYEPENYPAVRHRIRAAIDTSEDLDVYVKHPVCCSWFWDLADYGFVHIVNDGPVEQLKRKLGVPMIPTELVENPGRILELGLLDLPDPCKKVEDVWTWIIEQKLGKTWAASEPSFQHLRDLADWYVEGTVPQELRERAKEIEQGWLSKTTGKLKGAYQSFLQLPRKNALFLCCWQNLSMYEESVRERWLDKEGWYVPSLIWVAEKIPPLSFPNIARTKLSPKAHVYWNTYFQGNLTDER